VCTRGKETKIVSINRYIRFVEITSGLIKESRIPLYSSKLSKKTYNQHQLLILILLKEYLSEDYPDTVDLVDLMHGIKQRINLDSIPHFTTLHKFSQRISSFTFTRLLNRLIKMFYDWGERITCTLSSHPDLPDPMLARIILGDRKNTKEIPENIYFDRY
jgi:hypothetical protein